MQIFCRRRPSRAEMKSLPLGATTEGQRWKFQPRSVWTCLTSPEPRSMITIVFGPPYCGKVDLQQVPGLAVRVRRGEEHALANRLDRLAEVLGWEHRRLLDARGEVGFRGQ